VRFPNRRRRCKSTRSINSALPSQLAGVITRAASALSLSLSFYLSISLLLAFYFCTFPGFSAPSCSAHPGRHRLPRRRRRRRGRSSRRDYPSLSRKTGCERILSGGQLRLGLTAPRRQDLLCGSCLLYTHSLAR
jgi:hypothetical protein